MISLWIYMQRLGIRRLVRMRSENEGKMLYIGDTDFASTALTVVYKNRMRRVIKNRMHKLINLHIDIGFQSRELPCISLTAFPPAIERAIGLSNRIFEDKFGRKFYWQTKICGRLQLQVYKKDFTFIFCFHNSSTRGSYDHDEYWRKATESKVIFL